MYIDVTNKLTTNDQSNTGRGGLVITSFLDINGNGKRDAGEPKVAGLKFQINGGRIENDKRDTTVVIAGLEGYTNYLIEFNKNSFDNIGWRLGKSSMSIVVEPNYFTAIDVAVTIAGEVSGTVYSTDKNGSVGLARVIINFFDLNTNLVAKTITEADGYFSYMGLKPGRYYAQIDKAQLVKLNMSSSQPQLLFTIKKSREGDVVEGLKFLLSATAAKNK